MLHEFLSQNRDALIEQCRLNEPLTNNNVPHKAGRRKGIPLFLDQLISTLRAVRAGGAADAPGAETPDMAQLHSTACTHGLELLQHGFTVDQVVHHYGDLCQAITLLAMERDTAITTNEFRVLNGCLDEGIAQAVTAFTRQRELQVAEQGSSAHNQQLGMLASELRDQLGTATLALSAVRDGSAGISGASGAILNRSVANLHSLIERALADVRTTASMPVRVSLINVADFIAEVQMTAALEARAHSCALTLSVSSDTLAVEADADMLLSAVGHLLRNAFRFTRAHGKVSLRAYAQGDRLCLDVQDQCGGLAEGSHDELFKPFVQQGVDRTGLGLGLAISRRAVQANGGRLSVRNLPGSGCVFSIDLPLRVME